MLETNPIVPVSLHYWAAARAAAGVADEEIEARSVAEALQLACDERADPHFNKVIKASSVLIDGLTAHQEDLERLLTAPERVEVLPPFAGGNSSVGLH
jgi:molybdopterin synthase sulfur carrier subunit